MKIIKTLILMLLAIQTLQAQKSQLLLGKWKYKDVADREKLDSNTLKEARIYFGNTTMEFMADGKAKYNSLDATWELSKDESSVLLTIVNPLDPSQKTTNPLKIAALTAKELRVDMQRAIIIYDRPAPEAKAPAQPKPESQTQPKPVVKEVDKDAAAVYALYKKHDAVIRPKIKNLLSYLEASMKTDKSGEFNRSQWRYYSDNILSRTTELRRDLEAYKVELEAFGHKSKENELTDLLFRFFYSAPDFINACDRWADDIRQKDLDNNSILKNLEVLEKNSNLMVRNDNAVLSLDENYKKRNGIP